MSALLLALALAAQDVPVAIQPAAPAEAAPAAAPAPKPEDVIPPGAPTEDYPFVAWCYGAVGEYVSIYRTVLPDLREIDKMFGSSQPNEAEPYAEDMAETRAAQLRFANAIRAAERASPTGIADQGVAAIEKGRSVWRAAKLQPQRQLARAWLFWGVPDRCDTVAKRLTTRSLLLGQALRGNSEPAVEPASALPADAATSELSAPVGSTPSEVAPTEAATPAAEVAAPAPSAAPMPADAAPTPTLP